jgi:hypothetical protein
MRSASRRSRRSQVLAAAIAAASLPAVGQDFLSQQFVAPSDEVFVVYLGGIVNQFDTTLRLDGTAQTGTPINMENNGADDSASSFELGLVWRVAPRHRIGLTYYTSDRSGQRNHTSEINIGDASFPLGATVTINAENQFVIANYMYSMVRTPTFESALIVGIYGGKFDYTIDAVGNAGSLTADYHKSVSTGLPLPMLGITAEWGSPDKRWKISGLAQGIKAKIGDVDGTAYLLEASAEWMITRGFGVGARYRYADVQADVTKSDFTGNFDWKTNSVSLYGKFVF